jgi:hypothetical protein
MDALAGLLDNLALVATSNRTTVQQLTSVNLSLTTAVATLTAANKKLTKMVVCCNLAPQLRWQRRPPWSQSNLGKLLLDAWVEGIAYQQDLQFDWQETRTQ